MNDNKKSENNNQNFNLEEVVNNTNKSQTPANNTEQKQPNDREVVNAMQGNQQQTKQENLDTVVQPKDKTPTKKQETIDDILVEEEPKRSGAKTRWAIITGLMLVAIGGGLFLLLKDGNIKSPDTNSNTGAMAVLTGEETEQNETEPKKTEEETTTPEEEKQPDEDMDEKQLQDEYNIRKDGYVYYQDKKISSDSKNFVALGKGYAKDSKYVYYKGDIMDNVETDKFKVISQSGKHKLSGIIVSSKNLLEHLKERKNREFLMTTIASITNKNQNVKEELTEASIYAMDGFKNDYDELNALERWDEMTDLQRAKFGVVFLYVKIIKQLESDEIRMSKAKEELRYFIKNSDQILQKYGPEKTKGSNLSGNIGYDKYCVYHDGELFGCFLNEIFITTRD